jgi:Flp pilus assembly protein TadD
MKQDPRNSKYAPLLDGKYDTAVSTLDAELQRDPNSLEAQYCRATVEIEGGNLEDGINRLNKLLEQYPQYSFGYSERARANFKATRYDDAVADANTAIKLRPDVARNYARRAMANLLLHKSDAALADIDTAMKLAPNEDPLFMKVLKGRALTDLGRYKEALPLLSDSVTNAGKDFRPYFQRAVCYARLKDWKSATSDTAKALKLSPDDPSTKLLHAALLSARGEDADARKEFAAVLHKSDAKTISDTADLGPDVPSIIDAATVCLDAKDGKLANAILTRTEARRPLDPAEMLVQAKAELAVNDLFRTAKLLNQCLAIRPTWVEARVMLIKLYVKDNLPQKALEVQKEGLALPLSDKDKKIVAAAL